MSRILYALLVGLATCAFALVASADSVTYQMKASGVTCEGSAAHAERAVRSAGPVTSVETDPISHSVQATFDDDEVSLASIVESLEAAGMSVEAPVQVKVQ